MLCSMLWGRMTKVHLVVIDGLHGSHEPARYVVSGLVPYPDRGDNNDITAHCHNTVPARASQSFTIQYNNRRH